MNHVQGKKPLGALYLRAISLGLLIDGPLECLRFVFKTKMELSEQNVGMVFDGVFGILFLPVLYGTILAMCQKELGEDPSPKRPSIRECLVASLRYWGPLIVIHINIGLIVMVFTGIAFVSGLGLNYLLRLDSPYLLIPYAIMGALWGMVPLLFAPTLVVVEGALPWQARQRSRELVKQNWMKSTGIVLGFVLLPELLGLVLDQAPGFLLGATGWDGGGSPLWADGIGAALRLLLGAWGVVGIVITYRFYQECCPTAKVNRAT